MQAGREMDAAIQRDIFKTKVWFKKGEACAWRDNKPIRWYPNDWVTEPDGTIYIHPMDGYDGMIPRYSTDIAAAWLVVEKLRLFVMPWGDDEWCVSRGRDEHLVFKDIVNAYTAPLAICRAALMAVGEDK